LSGLPLSQILLAAVRLDMLLGCMFRMVIGVGIVSVGHVRVMGRFLVVAGFVMLCGFGVVVCGLRVVMGGLFVVMRCFIRHFALHSGLTVFVLRPQVRLESSATEVVGWVTTGSIEGEYALNLSCLDEAAARF
jgi:hypothetical protein